jgi:hypothetical protein
MKRVSVAVVAALLMAGVGAVPAFSQTTTTSTAPKSTKPAKSPEAREAARKKADACHRACFAKGMADKKYILPKSIDLECRQRCKVGRG